MNELKAKECCGIRPIFSTTDDFAEHTKTYCIRCVKCGRKVEIRRKIGEIAPKKAIFKLYEEWNEKGGGKE